MLDTWRLGDGREKHRCFLAVEEAYASPWFTSLPEEVSHAIVLRISASSVPDSGTDIKEIRIRLPRAVLAWATLPSAPGEDRAIVEILAGT